MAFYNKIYNEIGANVKELSSHSISKHEVWLLRFIAVVGFLVECFWTIFFQDIVPGFSPSDFQYLINSVCLAAVVYSFAVQLNERSSEYTKLFVGVSILAHSFYTTYTHNLHFSEILGSILTILVVYSLFKSYLSVALFSLALMLMIVPFFSYQKQSLVPTELAILLWGCLASISASSACLKIFSSEKARKQLQFTENLISNMSEGLIIHGRDHKIMKMNSAANKILEIESTQAIGKTNSDPVWQTYREDGRSMPHTEHPSYITLTTGQAVLKHPIKLACEKTNQSKFLLVSSVPIFENSDALPTSALVTILDVTNLKQKENELKNQEAVLFQAGKLNALGEMAAGIGHEINNPLAIVSARLSLLKSLTGQSNPLESNVLNQHIEKIEGPLLRIAKIVKTMRNFSRSDNRDPFEVKSLRTLIEETYSICKETLTDEKITLKIVCEKDYPIYCNSTQIEQVIMNLIQNSRDAIKNQKEKWIDLIVAEMATTIEVHCTDSGPRIPDDVADKMMQPFFTTKEIGKGTGLGLSISRTIVNHHKGTLVLNRNHPHTQFRLVLPKHSLQNSA